MDLNKLGFSRKTRVLLCKAVFIACVISGAHFFQVDPSCAGGAKAKTPCDPEYMDALEARAWLEAQREISQNQNLIFRPDSVLEYTCFDKFLNEAASNFAPNRQFSETDRWDGHPQGFSNTSTDTALNNVVMQPFTSYMRSNFEGSKGDYLNNRFDQPYQAGTSVTGGDYSCAEMQKVWTRARCMNFIEDSEKDFDGFYDFRYYEQNEIRKESRTWDLMCQEVDQRYAQARQSAFNNDQALFEVDNSSIIDPQGNGTPYREDDVVTHLDRILPGQCPQQNCIPTGVRVQRPDLGTFDERVCTNPGCPAPGGGGGGGGGAPAGGG